MQTKIVCTIGPASSNVATLEKMCLAGMNVARLNFSHGTHETHLETINNIKNVRKKLGLPIGIMLDTKGPEYRIGCFKDGKALLEDGKLFTFTPFRVLLRIQIYVASRIHQLVKLICCEIGNIN